MKSIIVSTLYLLTIFIPLTFTTINSELFEFPKFILLLSGTLVITVAWLVHYYQTKRLTLSYPLSPLSYSVLAILATQALATLFSLHPYTSFWGYYSRFHGGLLTTLCYTIIYFATANWMDNKSVHKLIKISVFTSFIISLYAIAERLGIDKNFWIQDVQNRVFSTLGQPNWLAAYLLPNIFLVLYLSSTKKLSLLLASSIYLVLLAALIFTKSRSGFLAFALSSVAYWLLLARQFSFLKIKQSLIFTASISLLISLILGTPYTPTLSTLLSPRPTPTPSPIATGTALEVGGTESGDIRKIVWQGAMTLIKQRPILGSGPETFAYTYYNVRPLAHNQTSEWDFLYNKAHNEYLNIASGAGLVGLFAYLYFHYAVFAKSLVIIPKSKKVATEQDDHLRYLYPVLGGAIVAFFVTNFFGFSVIPVYLMMIMLSALPTAMQNSNSLILNPKSYVLNPALFFISLTLIYPVRLFLADLYYTRGKAQHSIPLLERALAIRPGLDLFHAQLAEVYASAGQTANAISQAQISKTLNPYHLNYYKSRAKTYLTLAVQDPAHYQAAAEELEQARLLAPTDPKLAYNLGLIYTRLNNADKAIAQLQDSISLKPDYPEPYYALTLLYEQTKQAGKIPDLLSSAKTNLATYSAQLKEKIEKYTK